MENREWRTLATYSVGVLSIIGLLLSVSCIMVLAFTGGFKGNKRDYVEGCLEKAYEDCEEDAIDAYSAYVEALQRGEEVTPEAFIEPVREGRESFLFAIEACMDIHTYEGDVVHPQQYVVEGFDTADNSVTVKIPLESRFLSDVEDSLLFLQTESQLTVNVRTTISEENAQKDWFYCLDVAAGIIKGGMVIWFVLLVISVTVLLLLAHRTISAVEKDEKTKNLELQESDRIWLEIWLGAPIILACLAALNMRTAEARRNIAILFAHVTTGFLMSVGIVLYIVLLLKVFRTIVVRKKAKCLVQGTMFYAMFIRLEKYIERSGKEFPSVKLGIVLYSVLLYVEITALMELHDLNENKALFLFVAFGIWKLIGYALVVNYCVTMRRVIEGGRRIAAGDTTYRISTKHMFLSLRRHAKDLNQASIGMQHAIEEQVKSEHMKTELITNVSHDLKTPLTSIISYVDLLKKEEPLTENARKYLDVLDRQSQRLKRLTEDVVEASKAASGAINVNKEPLSISVLLAQVLGEYQEKLDARELTVVSKTEELPEISTDARLLWRVLCNIFGNVSKYAQENTRVYVESKREDDIVLIMIKNISKEELNLTGEELMERFVRGDASRNTEGSGLGLAIARSLVELLGGNLELIIDGDLFKTVIRLPITEQDMIGNAFGKKTTESVEIPCEPHEREDETSFSGCFPEYEMVFDEPKQ